MEQSKEQPILMVIANDAEVRDLLQRALERRFGVDYEVTTAVTSNAAVKDLEHYRCEGREVALVAADYHLPGTTGLDILTQAHTQHPGAKRALLTRIDDRGAMEPVHRATMLGEVDVILVWPWRTPEEWVYPHIQEALSAWWSANRPRFEFVQVVGERWNARSHELRDLLGRNNIPYGFYDATSQAGHELLAERDLNPNQLPAVILFDGQTLVDPSTPEIAEALGEPTCAKNEVCDVVVIGAGPSGLTAAVYGASEGLSTVVVEKEALGGQAGTSSMIRNYLGFPRGISGDDLTARAAEQAFLFGVDFVFTRSAVGLRVDGDYRVVKLRDGGEVTARAVVIATGMAYRRLGIPSLDERLGAGVFYGAATTEARALSGEDVFVVGAGNSAGQAALHLAKFARRVNILVRGKSLAASMSDYLIKEIEAKKNIQVQVFTRVVEGTGMRRLEGLVLEDMRTGSRETVPAAAVFVLIGSAPYTGWLPEAIQRDSAGYIRTDRDVAPYDWRLERPPLPLETSVPGVFAIGDVRAGSVKRVASAVGEGSVAIRFVHNYLADVTSIAIQS